MTCVMRLSSAGIMFCESSPTPFEVNHQLLLASTISCLLSSDEQIVGLAQKIKAVKKVRVYDRDGTQIATAFIDIDMTESSHN